LDILISQFPQHIDPRPSYKIGLDDFNLNEVRSVILCQEIRMLRIPSFFPLPFPLLSPPPSFFSLSLSPFYGHHPRDRSTWRIVSYYFLRFEQFRNCRLTVKLFRYQHS